MFKAYPFWLIVLIAPRWEGIKGKTNTLLLLFLSSKRKSLIHTLTRYRYSKDKLPPQVSAVSGSTVWPGTWSVHPKLRIVVSPFLYYSPGLIGCVKAYKLQLLSFLVSILHVLFRTETTFGL